MTAIADFGVTFLGPAVDRIGVGYGRAIARFLENW